ncbi:M48 family metallopeptidase [Methylomonas sp. SURF-2]|uniref:M48 family metallopeptidase n=1 Tax=Methylomonas subterranea TaxID=2952225 RepID=A0ABT1TKT7_9GAMM|nr:M48 family metallopeptidase [Methylomonas sp. SURF-2]MCQ8106073.1 M48 family metallopeptidase [Methylomonas sp. SURF-2]
MEAALGTRQKIFNEWPLRPLNDEATEFVQRLAMRLAAQYSFNAGGIPWRVYLVRNLSPNAFSIGGGFVFVNEGALTFAENEEEMIAILAHELGHELAGHFCKSRVESAPTSFFDFLLGATPASRPKETAQLGSLPQTIDPAKEQQADRIAISLLQASGYNPQTLLRVSRRLPKDIDGHWVDSIRIETLSQLLGSLPDFNSAPRDSEQFQRIKRMLSSEAPVNRF